MSGEIPYVGFGSQLANALFSFSNSLHQVLMLDDHAEPTDLARALDDARVNARPGDDRADSLPNAPAATAPASRHGGKTGSRSHTSAIRNSRWEGPHVVPRAAFESSVPEHVRGTARDPSTDVGSEEGLG